MSYFNWDGPHLQGWPTFTGMANIYWDGKKLTGMKIGYREINRIAEMQKELYSSFLFPYVLLSHLKYLNNVVVIDRKYN